MSERFRALNSRFVNADPSHVFGSDGQSNRKDDRESNFNVKSLLQKRNSAIDTPALKKYNSSYLPPVS